MTRLVPLTAATVLLVSMALATEAPVNPSWLKADAASKTAEFDVVAAFNENNEHWNFNGHHTGNATMMVPQGWTVRVPFRNEEEEVTHSLIVIADSGDAEEFPIEAGQELAAFSGAYTESPIDGTEQGKQEAFAFIADKPGDYLWYCGVAGHGSAGMWIRFRVAEDVQAPAVEIAADAEPGRD